MKEQSPTTDKLLAENEQLRQRIRELEGSDSGGSSGVAHSFEALVANSPVCIHSIDIHGKLTSVNAAGLCMLGSPAEKDVIGNLYTDVVQDSEKERIGGLLKLAIENGERSDFEFRTAEGVPDIVFSSCFVPIKDDTGKVTEVMGIAQDITEERENRERLQASEKRFRELFEGTTSLICVHDTDGVLIDANPAALEVLSVSKEEGLGRNLREFWWPETADIFDRYLEVMRRRGRGNGVMKLKGPDGNPCYWAYENVMRSEDGMDQIVAYCVDITARVNAEQELRQWKDIFARALWGIVLCAGEERTIQNVNRAFARMHGYETNEMLGMSLDKIIAPNPETSYQDRLERVKEHGRMVFHHDHIARDGRRFPVRADVSAVRDESGEILFRVSMVQDLTKELEAQEDARKKDASLKLLTEMVPAVLWSTDRDLQFTSSTGAGLDALGLEIDQLIGCRVEDFFAGDGSAEKALFAHRNALEGKSVDYETRIRDRFYRVHLEPLSKGSGRIEGVVGLAVDITDQNRSEEIIQQTQKLESIGVLAGGVAHDFNNLLLAVLGNAELLEDHLPKGTAQRALLDQITNAAQRGADLTNSMLEYSGRARFKTKLVDVSRVVRDMRGLLNAVVSKKVRIDYEFSADDLWVLGDVTQVRQIVMNLVTNGAEAIGERAGRVNVRVAVRPLDREFLSKTFLGPDVASGEFVAIEVGDNGSGMDGEVRTRIFDPFFSTRFSGRGLGMASVLGIVKRHKGVIEVQSEIGEGSTVTVYLPATPNVSVVDDGVSVEEDSSRLLILVADDEEHVRSLLANTLARRGVEVTVARDGQEAVDRFKERSSELAAVLLDMTMPVLGGEEAFLAMQNINPDVPVLLMSGYTETATMSRIDGAGPAGFLHKPFLPSELMDKLMAVIGAQAR